MLVFPRLLTLRMILSMYDMKASRGHGLYLSTKCHRLVNVFIHVGMKIFHTGDDHDRQKLEAVIFKFVSPSSASKIMIFIFSSFFQSLSMVIYNSCCY